MKENVFDVLVYLFENYMDTDGEPADPDSLRDELQQVGFPDAEVDKAFDWLEGLATQQEDDEPRERAVLSMRMFTADEKECLDVEAQGFLLFLEQSGILDQNSRELVIDRYMALGTEESSLEQLKWVVLMVLFNQPGSEAAYAWMEDLVYDNQVGYLH
jgi:Smg protein